MLADHTLRSDDLPDDGLSDTAPRLDGALSVGALSAPAPKPASRLIWICVASVFACHGLLIGLALWSERKLPDEIEQTTPVEIVTEVPKPPAIPTLQFPEAPKEFQSPPEPKKPDPPKFEKPKPEQQKAEQSPAKSEKPKPDAAKSESPKAEPPQADVKAAEPAPSPEPATPDAKSASSAAPQSAAPPTPADAQALPALPKPPDASPLKPGVNESILPPSAFAPAPKHVLRTEREIYAPMAFELMPGTFRDKALTPEGQKEADDYKADVYSQLEAAKRIPDAAKALRGPVAVVVAFTLDLNGAIVKASVLRSSGNPVLDAEALATVRRAAPFPLPPPQAARTFTPAIVFGPE